jgi:hypothetical protein
MLPDHLCRRNLPGLDEAILARHYARLENFTEYQVTSDIVAHRLLGVQFEGAWYVEAPSFCKERLAALVLQERHAGTQAEPMPDPASEDQPRQVPQSVVRAVIDHRSGTVDLTDLVEGHSVLRLAWIPFWYGSDQCLTGGKWKSYELKATGSQALRDALEEAGFHGIFQSCGFESDKSFRAYGRIEAIVHRKLGALRGFTWGNGMFFVTRDNGVAIILDDEDGAGWCHVPGVTPEDWDLYVEMTVPANYAEKSDEPPRPIEDPDFCDAPLDPPPVPKTCAPTIKLPQITLGTITSLLFRKVVFTAAILGVVAFVGYLASDHKDYPGKAEFQAPNSAITFNTEGNAHGNSDDARQSAAKFATAMKPLAATVFTGESGHSFASGGEFVTYCQHNPDSVAFIVHVPELRNYKDVKTREALANLAWTTANQAAQELSFTIQSPAIIVGLRGFGSYGPIWSGRVGSNPEVKTDEIDEVRRLYPFFIPRPKHP